MISTSKRPIICTTSANSYASKSNGLSKHINKIFTFEAVDPTATARDIEMLALAEGFHLRTEDLVHLVEDRNGGRVSSSIHALQTLLMSSVQHQHVSRNNPDFEEVRPFPSCWPSKCLGICTTVLHLRTPMLHKTDSPVIGMLNCQTWVHFVALTLIRNLKIKNRQALSWSQFKTPIL